MKTIVALLLTVGSVTPLIWWLQPPGIVPGAMASIVYMIAYTYLSSGKK